MVLLSLKRAIDRVDLVETAVLRDQIMLNTRLTNFLRSLRKKKPSTVSYLEVKQLWWCGVICRAWQDPTMAGEVLSDRVAVSMAVTPFATDEYHTSRWNKLFLKRNYAILHWKSIHGWTQTNFFFDNPGVHLFIFLFLSLMPTSTSSHPETLTKASQLPHPAQIFKGGLNAAQYFGRRSYYIVM